MNRPAIDDALDALMRCRDAYVDEDYDLAREWAGTTDGLASALGLHEVRAEARFYLGNILELEGHDGAAIREWVEGFAVLERAGVLTSTVALRLREVLTHHFKYPAVFLSYSDSESGFVEQLKPFFLDNSVRFKDYKEHFVAGREIGDEIARAMNVASTVLVHWSERYRTRPHCVAELESAFARTKAMPSRDYGIAIVLLRMDDTEVPQSFGEIIHIDARQGLTPALKRAVLSAVWRKEVAAGSG